MVDFKAPIHAYLELTQVCNLKCGHCMNYTRFNDQSYSEGRFMDIADKIDQWDIFNVAITGGEVLLRKPQLYALLDTFSRKGIRVAINTNLTRITSDDARKLKDYGVFGILTSLNGPSQEIHDSIVNKDGAFKQTTNGIEEVVRAGIPIGVNFVATKGSKDFVYETGRLAKNLGADYFSSTPLIPNSTCIDEHMSQSLSPEEMLRLLLDLHGIQEDFGLDTELQRVIPYCFFWDHEELRHLAKVGCVVGKSSVNIKPDGSVTSCSALNDSFGNVLEDDLNDIWQRVLNSKYPSYDVCKSCDMESSCSGGCKVENAAYESRSKRNPLIKSPIKLKPIDEEVQLVEGDILVPAYHRLDIRDESDNSYLMIVDDKTHSFVSSDGLRLIELINNSGGIIVSQGLVSDSKKRDNLKRLIKNNILRLQEEHIK